MSKFNSSKPVSYALYYVQFDYNNHSSRTSVSVYHVRDYSAPANYNFQNAFNPIIPETIQEQVFMLVIISQNLPETQISCKSAKTDYTKQINKKRATCENIASGSATS